MTTHHMRLDAEPFEAIRRGEKTDELRLNDEKRQRICVGDRIEFQKRPERTETIVVEVTALTQHKNFDELFDAVQTRYPSWTREHFIARMREHYSEQDEARYGALEIGLALIS